MAVLTSEKNSTLPGHDLEIKKMPGHWLLARFGKRVLRPGGREMTEQLLRQLKITSADDVVELAPGLGVTARMILDLNPKTYRGVEHDQAAANFTQKELGNDGKIVVGNAQNTGLADASANVIIGEAMLTMQSQVQKEAILTEAIRVLSPGGRYGVHELVIVADDPIKDLEKEISAALSSSIHVGARPLTEKSWREMFTKAGFTDITVQTAPMHLLEPKRLIADEGFIRAITIVTRILLNNDARHRVRDMRRVFKQYAKQLKAIAIVAHKPA